MSSVNKVILVGHLGKDPEVRYLASGSAVCNISIATSESWKDKHSGEKQERTEWHRISFFNNLAEVAGKYLKKGSMVYIEGKLKGRKWQAKDGSDRYSTDIFASEMKMLGGSGDGSRQPNPSRSEAAPDMADGGQQPSQSAPIDDDIPF